METFKQLSKESENQLLQLLEKRFHKNSHRHMGLEWTTIKLRLEKNPNKLWSLNEMEITGGEPDIISIPGDEGAIAFCDCSSETPKGRRSLCYDEAAWQSRKENKPENSALGMAKTMGIEILTEAQYRILQSLEKVDLKTSSWLITPEEIRQLGGAIFGDQRYNTVFVYHNGAESYYAVRGFRGILWI